MRLILGKELETHPYNTFGSFLKFYRAFKDQRCPLVDFYCSYSAEILPDSLSCVGLGCSLADALKSSLGNCYPKLSSALFLASCEEMILDIGSYTSVAPPSQSLSVKEHVLVVLRIKIGGREGYIVLDPGYHVGIPVIVMADGQYPNTGWFLLSETSKSRKEYSYTMDGPYIQWHVKETRAGKTSHWTNLVYVGRKFLSCVPVSEKRNLVYNFRTIVARDKKQPVAGVYCNLESTEEKFTFFFVEDNNNEMENKDYVNSDAGLKMGNINGSMGGNVDCFETGLDFNDNSTIKGEIISDKACAKSKGKRRDVKIPFEYFLGNRDDVEMENSICNCASQIGYNVDLLGKMILGMVTAFYDKDFMPHVLLLNRKIDEE